MLLRRIAMVTGLALLLILMHALWRDLPLREWFEPTHTVRRELVFDNGSVRDGQRASDAPAVVAQSAPGALRKCVRGERVSYSNLGCPEGWREQGVSRGHVNVVSSTRTQPLAAAAAPGGAPAPGAPGAPGAQQALRHAMDLHDDERLRQRTVERAVEGGQR